jgi:hypothetical protein
MKKSNFEDYGYNLIPRAINKSIISEIQNELLEVSTLLSPQNKFNNINEMWNHHRRSDRKTASIIYNAFKHLQSVKKLAICKQIEDVLTNELSFSKPVMVDINCRIDSVGEEKFLFDWHQDYWFSVCSPNAVVIWIPIVELCPDIGGLEIIDNEQTSGRIFNSQGGTGQYNSYADAVVLNESIDGLQPTLIQNMKAGDLLCFKFNTLHKSLPVKSTVLSRFTVQLRFADLADGEFIKNQYKPGIVNMDNVDYLKKEQ